MERYFHGGNVIIQVSIRSSFPSPSASCADNMVRIGILDRFLQAHQCSIFRHVILGQLGRPGKTNRILPALFSNPSLGDARATVGPAHVEIKASKVYIGGTKDAGHSAVLDNEGNLWLTGCDRWQQLGLGSSVSGASGYTWKNGALWHETFQRNHFLLQLIKEKSGASVGIRDVAVGGDHTVVLADNQRDVYSFGKGAEGQLGTVTKPFVSCPVVAKELSLKQDENKKIAAVCAIRHCSFTLDEDGNVLRRTGKCRMNQTVILNAVKACRDNAMKDSLLSDSVFQTKDT